MIKVIVAFTLLLCWSGWGAGEFPVNMIGPMTGPGQVPWDADLGVPMVWNGGTWFLEGDVFVGAPAHQGKRIAGNAIGGCKPLPCKVEWYVDGNANPIMFIMWPPNVVSCVPAGSCEANGNAYIWMMNVVQWGNGPGQTHAWSMLLRGSPTPANFVATNCYFEVDSKFVNAAMVVQPGTDTVFIFGTGLYRASPIFLASVPGTAIEDKSQWQYFSANVGGKIIWTPAETTALPTITLAVAGEISAIYSTFLGEYVITAFDFVGAAVLVLYHCPTPFGPWKREVIFQETLPYNWLNPADMNGAYGGYLVPDQGVKTPIIYMTLSFWIPYRTYMVQIDLANLGTGKEVIIGASDPLTGEVYNSTNPLSYKPSPHPYPNTKYDPHDFSIRNKWANQTVN